MAIRKEIKPVLVNTHHTMEMLRADYELEMFKFNDDRLSKFKSHYYEMDDYERDIMILYSEYNSYRLVAEETYCSHQMISIIMNVIRNGIKQLNSI